jgi:hypothetical protein
VGTQWASSDGYGITNLWSRCRKPNHGRIRPEFCQAIEEAGVQEEDEGALPSCRPALSGDAASRSIEPADVFSVRYICATRAGRRAEHHYVSPPEFFKNECAGAPGFLRDIEKLQTMYLQAAKSTIASL